MRENNYALTLGMLEKFSLTAWMSDEEREAYRAAWSQPGRLDAMLNWYRASPLVVPEPGQAIRDAPLLQMPAEYFMVAMPHLLIWGASDTALRPSAHEGLESFAPHLERMVISGADHWLIHTHPDEISAAIGQFSESITS